MKKLKKAVVVELPHPDRPGGCTRREIYYGMSLFGTGAEVPVRPKNQEWFCVKCGKKVVIDIFGDLEGTMMLFVDIKCPCGAVHEESNAACANLILFKLREDKKIY